MRWKTGHKNYWYKWFAWYPVRVGTWEHGDVYAWLEVVEKTYGGWFRKDGHIYHYQAIQKED